MIVPPSAGKKIPSLPGEIRNRIWDELAELLLEKKEERYHTVDPDSGTVIVNKREFLVDDNFSDDFDKARWALFSHAIFRSHASIFLGFLSRVSHKVMLVCDTPADFTQLNRDIRRCLEFLGVQNLYDTGHESFKFTVHIAWYAAESNFSWIRRLRLSSPLIKTLRVGFHRPSYGEYEDLRDAAKRAFHWDDGTPRYEVLVHLHHWAWDASEWHKAETIAAMNGSWFKGMDDDH